MQVYVNNKALNTEATHVAGLVAQLGLPAAGTAVAIGSKLVKRSDWELTPLTPDARLTVIQAACGG